MAGPVLKAEKPAQVVETAGPYAAHQAPGQPNGAEPGPVQGQVSGAPQLGADKMAAISLEARMDSPPGIGHSGSLNQFQKASRSVETSKGYMAARELVYDAILRRAMDYLLH